MVKMRNIFYFGKLINKNSRVNKKLFFRYYIIANIIPTSRKELNEYKYKLYLTQEQKDIIVGCCLGDLYIRNFSGKGCLFFEQKNKEYLFHLYEIFKPFVRNYPKERKQRRLVTSEYKFTWYFSTLTTDLFFNYRLLFYKNNVKYISDVLSNSLTPRAIAYWYMDDGNKSSNVCYVLSTCSFTEDEHNILINIFLEKYEIQVVMKYSSGYRYLYISKKLSNNNSHLIFKNLVKPYIVDSMLYKL